MTNIIFIFLECFFLLCYIKPLASGNEIGPDASPYENVMVTSLTIMKTNSGRTRVEKC